MKINECPLTNGLSQKERRVFQPLFFRGHIRFRVKYFSEVGHFIWLGYPRKFKGDQNFGPVVVYAPQKTKMELQNEGLEEDFPSHKG